MARFGVKIMLQFRKYKLENDSIEYENWSIAGLDDGLYMLTFTSRKFSWSIQFNSNDFIHAECHGYYVHDYSSIIKNLQCMNLFELHKIMLVRFNQVRDWLKKNRPQKTS